MREHFQRYAADILPHHEIHAFPKVHDTGTFEGRTVIASQKTWHFDSDFVDYCWTTRFFFDKGDPVDIPLYLRVDREKKIFRLTDW